MASEIASDLGRGSVGDVKELPQLCLLPVFTLLCPQVITAAALVLYAVWWHVVSSPGSSLLRVVAFSANPCFTGEGTKCDV